MADRDYKFYKNRLFLIEKMIRDGGYPSVDDFVAEFGVQRRTILRDIDFLRDRYNCPIEYDRQKKGYYYTDKTFLMQNVLLSESDLFTVSTIMPLMEQYKNTPLESSFKNIMSKLNGLLPDQVSVDSSFLNNDISFISDPLPHIDESVFTSIFKAIKAHKVLEFGYKSVGRAEPIPKLFDPYHVLCQKGNWYVLGYEHGARDTRVFALSRISELHETKNSFEFPKDFDINNHVDLSVGIWNNRAQTEEYELEFIKGMSNYILERKWHEDQEMIQKKDGSVVLKFRSNQKEQVFIWVLGFGDAVTVIKPEELRADLKKTAERILGKY